MLDIFGKGKLQDVVTVLEMHRGTTVDELINIISSEVVVKPTKKYNHVDYRKYNLCPSCGKNTLKNACGGRKECKCGYSEVK